MWDLDAIHHAHGNCNALDADANGLWYCYHNADADANSDVNAHGNANGAGNGHSPLTCGNAT